VDVDRTREQQCRAVIDRRRIGWDGERGRADVDDAAVDDRDSGAAASSRRGQNRAGDLLDK